MTQAITTQELDLEQVAYLAEQLRKPDGGFTIDPRTGYGIEHGYAVAIFPEFSLEIDAEQVNIDTIRRYLTQHHADLETTGTAFGGWHDPATDKVWLDVSMTTRGRAMAEEIAKIHNQIAIFDLDRGESITTGGTGK